METLTPNKATNESAVPPPGKEPFYRVLWVQVMVAMALAIVLGYVDPARAIAMKPLGDAFIRLISMIITLIIFCTVVTGIAGMENLKKVGRVGGMALLYFEVVSTIALLIGLVVGNVVKPGGGFNVNVSTLDAKSVADYAGQAKAQSVTEKMTCVNDWIKSNMGLARAPAADMAKPKSSATKTTSRMSPFANASTTVVGMMCIRNSVTLCALACPA